MAKPVSKPAAEKPNGILQPQPLNPVHELFYLLGVMRGANVDNAVRVAELANKLLIPATIEPHATND
jgi:hypothetical protein